MSKARDTAAYKDFQTFLKAYKSNGSVALKETEKEKQQRIKRLESDFESWFAYYFPNYYTAKPAPFHTRSSRRVLHNQEWYEVRAWSRELAKSARTMMEVIMLTITGKKRNVLLISSTEAAAIKLLRPYKTAFESNARLLHDYGDQYTHGCWDESHFITKSGASFTAIGAGQSPRGSRNEESRPDCLLIDDIDTDCRNPDLITKKWDWFERAVYATRAISNPTLIIFCGNIIAENCCIKRAIEKADHCEIINIRGKDGKSSWPAKNSESDINRTLSKISWAAQQGEYFNTPITEGRVFKKLHYAKIQPLNRYPFLIAYTDPSYKTKGDYKATVLLGRYKDEYHILRAYCAQVTTAEMLDWNYEIRKWVGDKTPIHFYIEYPWIDEPLKIELTKANARHRITINPKADPRKKPDKYHRIEANLEPINRAGKLLFNIDLQGSDHMEAAQGQFLALSPKSRACDDFPDAVEGAKHIADQKMLGGLSQIEHFTTTKNK